MSSILIKDGRIVTPLEVLRRGSVLIVQGKIRELAEGRIPLPKRPGLTINASGKIVVPGYIDLQVNGAIGEGFSQGPQDKCENIVRFFAEHGTTTMLATVVTDAPEEMLKSIRRAVSFGESGSKFADFLAGIHVEGPFLNSRRRGAHPRSLLRKPDLKEVRRWLAAGGEWIKMVTLAPELEGAQKAIRLLKREGIVAAASHSEATHKCMMESVKNGLSFVTHVGNTTDWPSRKKKEGGWLGVEPGVVGSFLTMDELRGSVILDGFHFHPAMLRPIIGCKGMDKVALITDAAFVAGLPPGTYRRGREKVTVTKAGYTQGTRKGWLAGSMLTMDEAVRNAVNLARASLQEAVTMATLTPATVLGLDRRKGRIAEGYDADLLVLDADLNVELVIKAGKVIANNNS